MSLLFKDRECHEAISNNKHQSRLATASGLLPLTEPSLLELFYLDIGMLVIPRTPYFELYKKLTLMYELNVIPWDGVNIYKCTYIVMIVTVIVNRLCWIP